MTTAKTIHREKLAFDNPEALQALIGSNNGRLKLVERTSGAQVNLRGNEITIEGDEAATETAKTALEQLYELALAGKPLSSDDVVRAVQLLKGDTGKITLDLRIAGPASKPEVSLDTTRLAARLSQNASERLKTGLDDAKKRLLDQLGGGAPAGSTAADSTGAAPPSAPKLEDALRGLLKKGK